MKIMLGENIRTLRRERKMTQEQLAEALGVTVGAVHKWERRSSLPELGLIVEMADLFGVSVDVLLGYEIKSSGAEDIIDRIRNFVRAKDYENALAEGEKALLRYPNTFRIVSCCADAYERKGVETGCRESLARAIELMERSIPLLSQNDDPQISEVTIRCDIAVCHIEMGQPEKGIEILRRYNAGGINNALLGLVSSNIEPFRAEETAEYLVNGMGGVLTDTIRCMSGYINYFIKSGDTASALEASAWLTAYLDSLKTDSDAVCYFDRITSVSLAVSAALLRLLGRERESDELLLQAYRKAAAFDRAPVYDVRAIRFVIGRMEKTTLSDDLGQTAIGAIENLLRSDAIFCPTLEKWEEIKKEYSADNKEDGSDE